MRATTAQRAVVSPGLEILVISLDEAEARRRLMRGQLDIAGMPPHRFIPGVNGRALAAGELARVYDEQAARSIAGRSLTAAEIGCARSHRVAYEYMVDRQVAMAVILEDDALLSHQFAGVVMRLCDMMDPARPQVILLSHVERYSAWFGRRVDGLRRLYRPYEAYGGHAYLINLAGAKSMLPAFEPVRTSADDWRYFAKAGYVEVFGLIPYLVGTSQFSTQSQIGNDRFSGEADTGKKLFRKLWFQLVAKPVLRLRKAPQTW